MNVWLYNITDKTISLPYGNALDGPLSYPCYAGRGSGLNDPAWCPVRGVGPLPVGLYRALAARSHPRLGPVAIPLEPARGGEQYGRSGFYVHGDNAQANATASEGCIVVQRGCRQRFAAGDIVVVVAR